MAAGTRHSQCSISVRKSGVGVWRAKPEFCLCLPGWMLSRWMQTDAHLYQIFRRFPELVFLLAGLPPPGPCAMKSVAIKAIARTMDGLIEPLDAGAPLQIVEF